MKATALGMLWHHRGRGQRDVPIPAALSLDGPTSHESPRVPRRCGAPPERVCPRRAEEDEEASEVRRRQSSPTAHNPARALPYSPATAH